MKKQLISLCAILLALGLTGCAPAGRPEADSGSASGAASQAGTAQEALTLEDVLAMADDGSLAQADFLSYSNGDQADREAGGGRNYYVSFVFPYEGDTLTLQVSLEREDDGLDAVYLRRENNRDQIRLHPADGSSLTEFLRHAYDIRDDISYTVPDGLEEGPYYADEGFAGARLLTPNAYEVLTDSATGWQYAAGMVSRFDAGAMLRWENGAICGVDQWTNTSSHEDLGPADGLCAPGFLAKSEYRYYSLGDWGELEQAGVEPDELETSGSYWQVFLARPGDEIGYVAALNTKHYTLEDAITFAESIRYWDETA